MTDVAASFQVLFGDPGVPAEPGFYDVLTTLEIEENADLPGAIQLTFPIATRSAGGADDLTLVGDDKLKPYARIAVVVSVEGRTDACIFDGYVLSHQVHLDKGITDSSLRVWGQDSTCLMNLDETTREWSQTDGAIANTIFADNYGFATAGANTQDDSGEHPESGHTVMQRGTDAQFLRDRARRAGRLFRVSCADRAGRITGYFIKPDLDASPVATLVLNSAITANVETLDIAWDVARPTEVKAKAKALLAKEPIDGGVTGSELTALDDHSLAAAVGTKAMKVMLTTTVDDVGELTARARSVLREAGWFVRCTGEVDVARLDVVLRAATVVQVDGAGLVHSGNYFVWSVRHTITAQSHRMKFVLVRNALGVPGAP